MSSNAKEKELTTFDNVGFKGSVESLADSSHKLPKIADEKPEQDAESEKYYDRIESFLKG